MLGTKMMSSVLSGRLADVLPPKQPNASGNTPAPFALERGFAEARYVSCSASSEHPHQMLLQTIPRTICMPIAEHDSGYLAASARRAQWHFCGDERRMCAQATLVGLSRSPAAKQREFAAELVKQLQELAGAVAGRSANALTPGTVRGAELSRTAWTAISSLAIEPPLVLEHRDTVHSLPARYEASLRSIHNQRMRFSLEV